MSNLPKTVRIFCVVAFVFALFAFLTPVHAAIDSCTASVDTHSVSPNSTNSMTFTITNGGPDDADWIKVSRPSSNFTVTDNYSIEGGWSPAKTESDITLTGTSLTSGSKYTFSVQIASANTTADAANWSVQLSSNGGTATKDCGGSLDTAIEGTVSVPPPSISNLVVSGISDSQATISWNTDTNSNSNIQYGLDANYGSTKSDGTMTTSHSFTLSSLTANTTYHYDVSSTDGLGNGSDAGDNTFTTAAQGTTVTTTVTGTVTTTTVVVRPTPSPTPTPDLTPPSVTVTTDITKPFTLAPTIQGSAQDKSGVAKVEYSLDGGQNFSTVDTVANPNGTSTTFSFMPIDLLDDNYPISIRATDGKGNTGVSKFGTLVIDRLPPKVGANIVTLGPQVLPPNDNGTIVVVTGLDTKVTLSAIGGPTKIDLNYLNNLGRLTTIPLKKNPDNGLWSGTLHVDQAGTYILTAHAVDGAGNITDRTLNSVVAVPSGSIRSQGSAVTSGSVAAYYFDTTSKQFVLWDGVSYGEQNPAPIDAAGRYNLYLPTGTYYLRVTAPGYETLETSIFIVDHASPVTTNFTLLPGRALKIGPWLIPLPDFRQTTADVNLETTFGGDQIVSSTLVGTQLPYFSFPMDTTSVTSFTLKGKPTILTFLNTWSPQTASQLTILNALSLEKEVNVVVIIPQESVSSVAIFRKRGSYSIPIIADPDGTLIDPLGIETVPTHIFVDRKGIIQDVRAGVFNKEELLDTIVK